MFISMPLLHQHPPPQQRGLVGLAVTIAVHRRVLLKSQRRRLFLLVALVLLSLSLFLLPQTTSRLFEAEGRVPEGAATWVDGAAVVQAGPRARRGQEPRPQFEHDTARLHFDNLHRTWGELDEGGDDGGLATTTGATGPVFNSNYSNVTVWLYTRAIRTRKNWQSVLHDLMGDMPVPVKMVMVPKPEDFPRALDIPGFHIFAVMKTFVPEVLLLLFYFILFWKRHETRLKQISLFFPLFIPSNSTAEGERPRQVPQRASMRAVDH